VNVLNGLLATNRNCAPLSVVLAAAIVNDVEVAPLILAKLPPASDRCHWKERAKAPLIFATVNVTDCPSPTVWVAGPVPTVIGPMTEVPNKSAGNLKLL